MDKEFNLIAVISIILKWKRPIIILTIVSAIAAALFSVFVMDEYFLSKSEFYPTNQFINDRATIFNTSSAGTQLDYYGGKSDINRVLSIANSEPVMNYIIDSFKLAKHYKIDTTSSYWKTKVSKKFDKNYEAVKTEHDAVEISIFDTDPNMASDMVNAVVANVDELNKQHVNETNKKIYNLISSQIIEQQKKVDGYIDTLSTLISKYNIKVVATGGTVVVEGNDAKAVQLYKALMSNQDNAVRELNNRINIKEQTEVSIKTNASSLYIVQGAVPAERREKPVRSLVVLITVLVTLFVSIIGVLLIEQFREIKKQL